MKLPQPTPDALAASHALQQHIGDEIVRHGGWISFARYMELALYTPGLGYYSGGSAKLGKDGDFTTAPEMTPLFGQTLAQVAADMFPQTGPRIMEFGAGSGKLAHAILTELTTLGMAPQQYLIVELSGELRARQQELLSAFPQVAWVDAMPEQFSGVALGNEVLDAMPINLVRRSEQGWDEVGVTFSADGLAFLDRPCDAALLDQIEQQIPDAQSLPAGYLTEVHPVACGFMRSLAAALTSDGVNSAAAAIFIDYGFPRHEYYLEQRAQGTLMCHYRHHSHPDPFFLPGLQDITAHVDFTAMANAAIAGGLELLGYTSQSAFLIAAGIGEKLTRTNPSDARAYLPQANAVQRLVSPAEMGELFKVLTLGINVSLKPETAAFDRSHRL